MESERKSIEEDNQNHSMEQREIALTVFMSVKIDAVMASGFTSEEQFQGSFATALSQF